MFRALSKIWRMPLRYAVLLVLPLQIMIVWVAHSGWDVYRRNRNYRFDEATALPFDLEQWRYFAKKQFQRTNLRAFAPDVRADDLPAIAITLDRRHMGSLDRDLPKSGKESYYPATIVVDGESHRVKVRYVGDSHWHWLYPQKSGSPKAAVAAEANEHRRNRGRRWQ